MNYERAKKLKSDAFKRLCGVSPETFAKMVKMIENHEESEIKTGRPSKLSRENQVLMTLEYLREYRTYFHIGQSWGLNESNVYRTIRKIENILIQEPDFRLPGKKELLKEKKKPEAIVIDVTESPIERPKKNRNCFIVVRKRSIL